MTTDIDLYLDLDSNKLDLGLGLALARGPTRGAPKFVAKLDWSISEYEELCLFRVDI